MNSTWKRPQSIPEEVVLSRMFPGDEIGERMDSGNNLVRGNNMCNGKKPGRDLKCSTMSDMLELGRWRQQTRGEAENWFSTERGQGRGNDDTIPHQTKKKEMNQEDNGEQSALLEDSPLTSRTTSFKIVNMCQFNLKEKELRSQRIASNEGDNFSKNSKVFLL